MSLSDPEVAGSDEGHSDGHWPFVAAAFARFGLRLLEETEYSSPQFAVISARVNLLGGPAEDADVAAAGELATSHTPRVRMELLLIRADPT